MLEPNFVGRSNNTLSSKKRHQHRCYQMVNLVIFSLGSDISKIWVYKYSILSWPFWCFWWYDAHNENILHRKRLSTQRDDVFLRLPDTDYAHSNFFLHTDHCCAKKSRLEWLLSFRKCTFLLFYHLKRQLKWYFKSIAARLFCCGKTSPTNESVEKTANENEEKQSESDKETSPPTGPSVKESLLSLKFLAICIYATIAQTRMNSIPGWTYSWLQEWMKSWYSLVIEFRASVDILQKWSFGPDGVENIDLCMIIFGWCFFLALVIAPFPGFLISFIAKKTGSDIKASYFISIYYYFIGKTFIGRCFLIWYCNSEKGKIGGLTFLFLFTALIGLSIR